MVYVLKHFRGYLLGCHFTLQTNHDHGPLQWLSSQNMKGLLRRWALSLQEFNFNIEYWKGSANANAGALVRCHGEVAQLNVVASYINGNRKNKPPPGSTTRLTLNKDTWSFTDFIDWAIRQGLETSASQTLQTNMASVIINQRMCMSAILPKPHVRCYHGTSNSSLVCSPRCLAMSLQILSVICNANQEILMLHIKWSHLWRTLQKPTIYTKNFKWPKL